MTTAAPVFVEFRCNRCWYSNCADTEASTDVNCRNCGQQLDVPEATPDRIARALALLEQEPDLVARKEIPKENESNLVRDLSDQKIVEIARKQSTVSLNQMDFTGYAPASIVARLTASLLDGAVSLFSWAIGVFFIMWLAKAGIVENPFETIRLHKDINPAYLVIVVWTPALLLIVQWYLLATSGQTLGKNLLMIRIVSESGRLPGFLQAVVLRNWVRVLLSFIPFFGLIDLLFIFSASRKCLHDYIAGTRVISAL